MKAMILAAGFGTRMLPLTRRLPKALLPAAGRTLLEWNLRFLASSGATEVVVNAHHLAEEMRRFLRGLSSSRPAPTLPADSSSQVTPPQDTASRIPSIPLVRFPERPDLPAIRLIVEERILGTAGGIANAARYLDSDPVIVMNVDLLFRPDLRGAATKQIASGSLATLLCVRDPLHAQIRCEGDRILEIAPRPVFGDPDLWGFTGAYLLSAEAVRLLAAPSRGEPRLPPWDIVPEFRLWLREGRLGVVKIEDVPFREAGTPETYWELLRDLSGPVRESLLGSAAGGDRTADAMVAPGAQIGAGAEIEESVVLDGAVVEAGARVRRSILGPGAVVAGIADRVLASNGQSRPLRLLSREEEQELDGFLERHAPPPEPLKLDPLARTHRPQPSVGKSGPVRRAFHRLQGDGSARQILRAVLGPQTRVVVRSPGALGVDTAIYPQRGDAGAPNETSAFVYVAEYLRGLGVYAPRIDAVEAGRGLLLLEDFGDTRLYDLCRGLPPGQDAYRLYQEAIDVLLRMQDAGPEPFDPGRTHNVPYDLPFILRYEAGYFHREMLRDHCGIDLAFEELEPEYTSAARQALEGRQGFMHRDYQSRNLMVTPAGLGVIDFQGARLGPPEYDLAALLLDPYVTLPPEWPARLLERYLEGRGLPLFGPDLMDVVAGAEGLAVTESDAHCAGILRRFTACGINRMLQTLGALAYLGGRQGKPGFLEHAPQAALCLRDLAAAGFPRIAGAAEQVWKHLEWSNARVRSR